VGCTIGVVFDEAVTATFPAFERAANTNNPGSWSSPATIPLPAALPLMAAGIGSLALLARRRK
jgi:hypothetical protein